MSGAGGRPEWQEKEEEEEKEAISCHELLRQSHRTRKENTSGRGAEQKQCSRI